MLINTDGDMVLRPSYLENSLLQIPFYGSAKDHLLANYRQCLIAIILNQFDHSKVATLHWIVIILNHIHAKKECTRPLNDPRTDVKPPPVLSAAELQRRHAGAHELLALLRACPINCPIQP